MKWYDFTLYLYMTTVLSRVFFGSGSGSVPTTLAVFAVAYVMRPLGALAFGQVGDRLGRRTVLLASTTAMTLAMPATALLPTREQIGSAAGALLLLLRCVMGFSAGGECHEPRPDAAAPARSPVSWRTASDVGPRCWSSAACPSSPRHFAAGVWARTPRPTREAGRRRSGGGAPRPPRR
ncbi:MFS transporter [Streptomyces sp. NPDC000618]|uniref:MFS transporter n=1 Tax=Streptomyces sp. NPDC000618 TaxID=3154265 RepID=UPI00332ED4F7